MHDMQIGSFRALGFEFLKFMFMSGLDMTMTHKKCCSLLDMGLHGTDARDLSDLGLGKSTPGSSIEHVAFSNRERTNYQIALTQNAQKTFLAESIVLCICVSVTGLRSPLWPVLLLISSFVGRSPLEANQA